MKKRFVALALAVVALAACGDSGRSASRTSEAASTAGDARAATVAGAGAAPSAAVGPAPAVVDDPSILKAQAAGLKQIYSGSMQIEVTGSVFDAGLEAKRTVTDAGGYVFSERSVRSDSQAQPTSEITFKIPPERFTGVLDQFARTLGTERGRQITADDVTAQFVDLTARVKTAEVSLDRVRKLLADAKTVSEVLTLEGEVAKRETQLEQLKGQLNQLSARVDYATVTLTLAEKIATPTDSDAIASPLDGLEAGWRVFLRMLQVVVLVLAVIVPFVPLFVLAWWLGRRFGPRVRRWAAPTPRPLAPLPPPPAPPSTEARADEAAVR